MKHDDPTRPRRLSAPLLAGMLTVPTVFVWLFLRRGYTSSLRRIAFIYTAIFFGLALLGSLNG
jgi:hypothetical protein